MELYTLHLHFPDTYGSLGNEALSLQSTDYYDSAQQAIERAHAVAEAFVTPRPDYWYLEDGAAQNIWTNSPDDVKKAIKYDLLTIKPKIYEY